MDIMSIRNKSRYKRIKFKDKSLIMNFARATLLSAFTIVILIFNLYSLFKIDWSLSVFGILRQFRITPLLIISIFMGLGICIGLVKYYIWNQADHYKQLQHRQSIARMIVENRWYDTEIVKVESFFSDIKSRKKEIVTYFPKIWYKAENGVLTIKVEISMGKYQEQFFTLEKKLESGLFAELITKELKEGYLEYKFMYDMIANRISIDEVEARDGKLKLMKNLWWDYDNLPNMLICGGIGGGKTYFLLTIIKALLNTNAKIYIADPKNADLADLEASMDNVYYRAGDIAQLIDKFHAEMLIRTEKLKNMPTYQTGENYAYAGLEARFLVLDEYAAFLELVGKKENGGIISKMQQIIMMGRQIGFFVILGIQRPDAKYLPDGVRDQFNFRVGLGNMSDLGYSMLFGETNKKFYQKAIKGRGYVDMGVNVISEFYTPLVPKGYKFINEIGKLSAGRKRMEKQNEVEEKTVEEKEES